MITPDAAATVLLLHGDPDADPRAASAVEIMRDDPAWIVPEHWRIEVLSATRGLFLGGQIGLADAEATVQWLRDVTVETAPTVPHLQRVWELHANLSAYDAGYVAVAELHGVTLVTADVRIQRAGVARCPIRLVG
ncbi:type II toxin-antitoxin system VapC family toxin [Microlunatus elymi]|uniref:Ribonuclease VapC n=1 Tax=Microlunatus elymi TaxID=2596828 RepID=A0A516PZ89_9ACTN|nr:type II toxin-antitoxin system VapC family toxin [Microlunatus elymi]QDP96480.1 type II toxin-antitoxin system VapC family toxin [Microlunatus elymi]